jgi:hypothetical protein
LNIILDKWQKEVLEAKGDICICTGRQVGKSLVISYKAGEYIVKNKNKSVLIISLTERQAEELFAKCLNYVFDNYPKLICKGKDRPTKHTLKLINGSVIRCLPTGVSGAGIRGFTIDMLIADEAAQLNDNIWQAVTPMLFTTGGDTILISTPLGRDNYFYRCFNDEHYTKFHISSEEVAEQREISRTWTQFQRENALDRLAREKKSMSKLRYAQEYLGQFVEKLMQFFPDDLILQCMNGVRREAITPNREYYLGVDVAAMGKDESTFEIIDRIGDDLKHVENLVTTRTYLQDTVKKIIELNSKYDFKKIFIDDGGVGVGVFEQLLFEPSTKRKVVAINNSSRSLDKDDNKKKKLLKNDLYNNLLRLMEQGKISLLDDTEIYQSLKSVQFEYTDIGEFRIFGNYTHIVEGLIRASWCTNDKSLNLWLRST